MQALEPALSKLRHAEKKKEMALGRIASNFDPIQGPPGCPFKGAALPASPPDPKSPHWKMLSHHTGKCSTTTLEDAQLPHRKMHNCSLDDTHLPTGRHRLRDLRERTCGRKPQVTQANHGSQGSDSPCQDAT